MKITLLSHASVLIEEGPIAICSDPWFIGDVFNESWSLLRKPALTESCLQGVSHIWISHEHPDHLNFPTLKSIPPEQKAKITVLYQRHFSPRIFEVLAKLGFRQVIELPLAHWFDLGEDVSVMCCSIGSIDSLLAVRSKGVTVLNTNDCVIGPSATRALAKSIGPVDVLLTQFSIASWVGNPGEADVTARHEVIDRMERYISAFRPRITIPFASFVYFCHKENHYMNAWINTPDHVQQRLSHAATQLEFLYNGDSWSSEDGLHVNGDPLERYRADFQEIQNLPYRTHQSYSLEELRALGNRLIHKVQLSFPWLIVRKVAPIYFYLVDLNAAIRFDLRRGTVEIAQRTKEQCDIALSSQALWFAFKFPWGFNTLDVSGRYERINSNVNMLALYLCHLHCVDMHFTGLFQRLLSRRVWSFCWSKRHEMLGTVFNRRRTGTKQVWGVSDIRIRSSLYRA